MRSIPRELWPKLPPEALQPLSVHRDADFLVTIYPVPSDPGMCRLTVCRAAGVTKIGDHVVYRDGITWDDLMQCKRDVGLGNRCAVELFPPDDLVVNVANMRHLWVLTDTPSYAWGKDGR